MKPIQVVVADDHALFREGLKRVLSVEKDVLVVGEAGTGAEAVQVCERMHPDILLLDLKMPTGGAVEPLLRIAEKSPETKVMMLTAYSARDDMLDSAKNRARAYVLKGIDVATLLDAIRKVHAGEIWVDPDLPSGAEFRRIARQALSDLDPPANHTLDSLTRRELEILELVAEGLSNEEIGKKLFISTKTVKTHLGNIFDKLHVNNRFKAALWVMPNSRRPSPLR